MSYLEDDIRQTFFFITSFVILLESGKNNGKKSANKCGPQRNKTFWDFSSFYKTLKLAIRL